MQPSRHQQLFLFFYPGDSCIFLPGSSKINLDPYCKSYQKIAQNLRIYSTSIITLWKVHLCLCALPNGGKFSILRDFLVRYEWRRNQILKKLCYCLICHLYFLQWLIYAIGKNLRIMSRNSSFSLLNQELMWFVSLLSIFI